jgi:hypothetical protein
MWEVILATGVAMNVGFGPFDGQAWWHQMAEAAMEHAEVAGKDCPLLAALLPKIAAERDELDMYVTTDYAKHIAEQIQQSRIMTEKGPKLALCRWMSWLDCYAFWKPLRSMRAICMVYIGIQQGWITADPSSTTLKLKAKDTDPGVEDGQKMPVSRSPVFSQLIHDTRGSCHNTLHIATNVMLDEDLQRKSSIIYTICAATRERHTAQCTKVRSPEASLEYYSLEAAGAGLEELSQILRVYIDSEVALSESGFAFLPEDVGSRALAADDAVVVCEDTWMTVAMGFAITLAKNRARTMLWNMEGFPGHLAALAHPDPVVVRKGHTHTYNQYNNYGSMMYIGVFAQLGLLILCTPPLLCLL